MITEEMAQVFRLQAALCRTLADANRLMILYELSNGERSVGRLASALGLPQSNISRHLALLREQGVVDTCRSGTTVNYSLSDPKITQACNLMLEILEGRLARSQQLSVSIKIDKEERQQTPLRDSL